MLRPWLTLVVTIGATTTLAVAVTGAGADPGGASIASAPELPNRFWPEVTDYTRWRG